jgi:hypothetical protein
MISLLRGSIFSELVMMVQQILGSETILQPVRLRRTSWAGAATETASQQAPASPSHFKSTVPSPAGCFSHQPNTPLVSHFTQFWRHSKAWDYNSESQLYWQQVLEKAEATIRCVFRCGRPRAALFDSWRNAELCISKVYELHQVLPWNAMAWSTEVAVSKCFRPDLLK